MTSTGPTDPPPGESLPAGFGTSTAVFVVVSSMVGVGVLTTSGFTVAAVGSNQVMLGLWAVGGIMAVCGALAQAELSAALPRAGGDYAFLHEAYGPTVAFLSGWVSFLIGFAGPIAVAAAASAEYLLGPLGFDPGTPRGWLVGRTLATATILFFAAVHVSGRSRTVGVQGGITVIKIAALVLFIVAGLASGRGRLANLDDRPEFTWPLVQSCLFSLVYISYGYTGWNAASYLAAEVAEPQRRLPRAILFGTVGVTVLYLALNLVYALALPAADIRAIAARDGFDAVAPIAKLSAVRLFGERAAVPVSIGTGILLWSTLSAYILTGPRVLYAMARAGQFPALAGRLSHRTQTPAIATALQVGWALLLLWVGSIGDVLVYTSVGLALFSILAVAAVYILRARRPDLPRPFRVPGYPITPLGYLIPAAALTVAAFVQAPIYSALALASILAGVPICRAWRSE